MALIPARGSGNRPRAQAKVPLKTKQIVEFHNHLSRPFVQLVTNFISPSQSAATRRLTSPVATASLVIISKTSGKYYCAMLAHSRLVILQAPVSIEQNAYQSFDIYGCPIARQQHKACGSVNVAAASRSVQPSPGVRCLGPGRPVRRYVIIHNVEYGHSHLSWSRIASVPSKKDL